MSGQELDGKIIQVKKDADSNDGTKVIVSGLDLKSAWQEIKDFFKSVATPIFVARQDQAEVRFDDAGAAVEALQLNGTLVDGAKISVILDEKSQDQTKVQVHGLNSSTEWQELKDHFSVCGNVAHAKRIVGPGGKEFKQKKQQPQWDEMSFFMAAAEQDLNPHACGPVAEVRFASEEAAQKALEMSGTVLEGRTINVKEDKNSKDGTKVIVTGLSHTCQWQELKDHFAGCGRVAFAGKKKPMGAGMGAGAAEGFAGVQKAFLKQAMWNSAFAFPQAMFWPMWPDGGFHGFKGKGKGKGW